MNLVEALLKANNESRDFLRELEDCERLAPGPGVALSRTITETLIAQTEAALASGDVMLMLKAAAAHGIGGGEEQERAKEEMA